MARRTVTTNYRVEVRPARGYFIADEATQAQRDRRTCDEIAKAIRRHVDDVDEVEVKWDTRRVCEFCGDDDERNGSECCEAALDHAIALRRGGQS